ncbi:MAG: ABC transporter ATP-binding protein [Lautropia sp.]|nr:ABC transporter ATP-binding protein [Lautropia sp.]
MIRIENLSHRYAGATSPALDKVSFEIGEGESLGLLGPNGAGKTTLMSLLAGLQTIQAGEIYLDGHPLATAHPEVKQRISLVPQDFALYPTLTVRENMRFFAALYGRDERSHIDELLETAHLSDEADRQVRHLSGGMKRRLNFAVGLINSPKLMFLDEITVGIDTESRQFILESLAQLNSQGVTIVYTSHYLQEIETLCSSMVLIDRGMLIYDGPLDDILNRSIQDRLVFKPLRPLNDAELIAVGGRTLANGAIEVQADQRAALLIWQELERRGIGTAYFHAGNGSLESFYLNFLQQQVS